jgi:hypothetical protein
MKNMPAIILALSGFFGARAELAATRPDFQSKFYAAGFSRAAVSFNWLAVDSLGQGKLAQNPVAAPATTNSNCPLQFQSLAPGEFAYVPPTAAGKAAAAWRISCRDKTFTLRSDFVAGTEVPPLTLTFNQKVNHATLLGMMQPGDCRVALPAVLHLPDMGSVRVTCNLNDWKLEYDARRHVKEPFVQVTFPPATAAQPQVEYKLEVTAIYPGLPGIEENALYDGFRRDYLNIFQVNPRFQMLANNSSSDPVTFAVFAYSEIAATVPPLAEGLTCLDLLRMTLDRYFAGVKGYGQIGYGLDTPEADVSSWTTPWNALDSYPSLIISACNYAQGAQDWKWARANYDKIARLGREMLAADTNGNGLIEYPGTGNYGDRPLREKRPANWWDTINFGNEDAYANALAYQACVLFSEVARKLDHVADAEHFTAQAAKLRAAYLPTFLNPDTGVLAGWKSADGQLHDYWFTFVQGVAITYGLMDAKSANGIMDRLLAKMADVGYTNFSLGLPGNLVPVRKGDYVHQNTPPTKYGEPKLEDGSDGFQFYENGGATGCYAYFTIKALYQLGRIKDARRIFHPMLAGYANGDFQGFGDNGMSRDWRDWGGGCHGYEGLLVENYLPLLAVFDDLNGAAGRHLISPRAGK